VENDLLSLMVELGVACHRNVERLALDVELKVVIVLQLHVKEVNEA